MDSGMRIPRVMVKPSAPSILSINELPQGSSMRIPSQGPSQEPSQGPSPYPLQSAPYNQTANTNETNTSAASGPQIIYVVQPVKETKSTNSCCCELCVPRLIGFFIGLIIIAIVIAVTK